MSITLQSTVLILAGEFSKSIVTVPANATTALGCQEPRTNGSHLWIDTTFAGCVIEYATTMCNKSKVRRGWKEAESRNKTLNSSRHWIEKGERIRSAVRRIVVPLLLRAWALLFKSSVCGNFRLEVGDSSALWLICFIALILLAFESIPTISCVTFCPCHRSKDLW